MTSLEARPAGAVSVLADGLTVAAGSSRLLRGPSIYLGLLTLALAGPGVVSQLWVLSWSSSVDLFSDTAITAADEAIGLSSVLLVLAFAGLASVSIEGGAIGAMLIAGRVTRRSVTLRLAVERSRRVFWRLVRAALAIGLLELAASLAWRAVTNAPPMIEGIPNLSIEVIPGAIVSLPFIYSSVAIVIADDGTRAALRRSIRLARQRLRLAFALGAFALLSGVLEGLALGSGLDLIVRVTEAVNLDVTMGGASLFLAIVLALAIVTAAGSLVFTVSALVSAPQIVAWDRLGLSMAGLPAPEPVAEPEVAAEPAEVEPGVVEPEPGTESAADPAEAELTAESPVGDRATASDPGANPSVEAAAPPVPAAAEPRNDPEASVVGPPEVASPPAVTGPTVPQWGAPPAPAPSAWAAAAGTPARFRWVTIPMRLTAAGLWLVTIASMIGGPPT